MMPLGCTHLGRLPWEGFPMNESQSDEYALLQDVLDAIVGGETQGHACPFCGGGPLEVPVFDEGGLRVECPDCKKFFEGKFR